MLAGGLRVDLARPSGRRIAPAVVSSRAAVQAAGYGSGAIASAGHVGSAMVLPVCELNDAGTSDALSAPMYKLD